MARAANLSRRNALQRTALLAGALIAVTSPSACALRGGDVTSAKAAPAQRATVENLKRRPISNTAQIKQVVDSAIEQTQHTLECDPSYTWSFIILAQAQSWKTC